MATYLVTCDGYSVIREVPFGADLPALCREEELKRSDTYAVIAQRDSQFVADAEGYYPTDDDGREYRSAIDRACGYDAI